MHAPEVVSSSQLRHVAIRTNCTLWITRYIPKPYQENMTTLSSDTCSESLKTHKHDKKEQELIIGTLVMKITCTTCIIRNKLHKYCNKEKRYSLKYLLPNVSTFSFHLQSRWKRNVPGEWGYMYLLKGYVFFLALILVYIYVTVLYVRTIDARKEKKNCCMFWNFLIEFLTFHW